MAPTSALDLHFLIGHDRWWLYSLDFGLLSILIEQEHKTTLTAEHFDFALVELKCKLNLLMLTFFKTSS